MSLLNEVLGKFMGQSNDPNQPAAHRGILDCVLGMVMSSGGLNNVLQGFQQNGLGHLVQSWVSTGQNLPVNTDQVMAALGYEKVQEIAQKLGLSPEQAASGIAKVLPHLVDKLTPDGKLPDMGTLTQALSSLKGALAGNPTA